MRQGDTIVAVDGVSLAKEVSSGKLGDKENAVSAMIRGKNSESPPCRVNVEIA